jgi:hypothetical protein
MCDCHPMTLEEKDLWKKIKQEPNTIEDWRDLHDAIEGFCRRKLSRHRPCHNYSPAGFAGHWREWHRGHGCHLDDGKPRSAHARAELAALGYCDEASGATK